MNAPLGPVMSFGPSLARRMSTDDAAAILHHAVSNHSGHCVIVGLTTSNVPRVVNVNAVMDYDLTPAQSLLALRIVAQRLEKLYDLADVGHPVPIDQSDAVHIRALAEQLVDRLRASRVTERYREFDISRADAVREVVIVLATAGMVPSRLRGNG